MKEVHDLYLGSMSTLKIGLSPLYAQALFIPAYTQLLKQRPAAKSKVSIHLNDELLKQLRRGEIDLAISSLPSLNPPDLKTIPLISDDICIVVRKNHPLLEKRQLKLQDLVEAQWMLPGAEVFARRHIESLFTKANLPAPKIAIEISNTAGQLTQLIRDSNLVSIISESLLKSIPARELEILPLPQARFKRTIGVTLMKHYKLSPLCSHFIDLLKHISNNSSH